MEAKNIPLKPFLFAVIAVLVSEAVFASIMYRGWVNLLMFQGLLRIIDIGLVLGCVLYWGLGWGSIGLNPERLRNGLKKGILWSAGCALAVLLAFGVLHVLKLGLSGFFRDQFLKPQTNVVLYFAVAGLVAPIAEELFFRGLIYGFFRQWGVVAAVLASTLLFVLAHPLRAGLPVAQIIGGLLFAAAYEHAGSLVAPIIVHVSGNLAIFTLGLVFATG
jgi:membrane protease YdiL (CAAX protease family)